MRKFLLGLFCAGLLGASPAIAGNNDLIELGVGLRYLFDSDTYGADNPDVNVLYDTMPFAGDYALGIGFHSAVGHRFDSRRSPWEFRLRHDFYVAFEDEGTRDFDGVAGLYQTQLIKGTLYENDIFFSFRFENLLPIDIEGLYYELGLGVVTLSYDYTRELTDPVLDPVVVEDRTVTRSGMGILAGLGYHHTLTDDTYLTGSAEFVFSQIQDITNNSGTILHASPNANGLHFRLTFGRFFTAPF
jgi:hypothetical protein